MKDHGDIKSLLPGLRQGRSPGYDRNKHHYLGPGALLPGTLVLRFWAHLLSSLKACFRSSSPVGEIPYK